MDKPSKHLLSKTTYMYGCQCPKRLWLNKYKYEEKDEITEDQYAIFQQGTNVGLLAQQLFPNGIDASPESYYDFQQSVVDTVQYINEGHKVIYEAAFQYEGVLCAIDILVKKEGKWYAYEVKSSTSAKPAFIEDAALQYYVITNSGIDLSDISIVHLNNKYVREGELDIEQLFTIQSILDQVKGLQNKISENVEKFKIVIALKSAPQIEMGKQCNIPYECDFKGFCSKGLAPIEDDFGVANIDRVSLKEFTTQLKYPLYYMDFETWITAVPEYDGHWSYRQIPFQYSLHIQSKTEAELKHIEYLAEGRQSSLKLFIETLIDSLGETGSIIVYNKGFENTRLNELKEDYPQYTDSINKVQTRIIDLMTPFAKGHYYLPEMQDSHSIKYVLPALVPELSYADLEISNGAKASSIFYNLQNETDQTQIETTRKNLLLYCGLDTLAMVKILEKIKTEV